VAGGVAAYRLEVPSGQASDQIGFGDCGGRGGQEGGPLQTDLSGLEPFGELGQVGEAASQIDAGLGGLGTDVETIGCDGVLWMRGTAPTNFGP
jgi:hypothetical protein